MTPSDKPSRLPTGIVLKRQRALKAAGVTHAEVARRYMTHDEGGLSMSQGTVSNVVGGRHRSRPLERFIELVILRVPRFTYFPED